MTLPLPPLRLKIRAQMMKTSYRSYASSEGIAGAGGGELGIAGSLSLVFSYDSSEASQGQNVGISAPGDIDVTATSTNKIVNRAWAVWRSRLM